MGILRIFLISSFLLSSINTKSIEYSKEEIFIGLGITFFTSYWIWQKFFKNSAKYPSSYNDPVISKEIYTPNQEYIGYVYYRIDPFNHKKGYIFSIKIEDKFRSQGYGKQLIDHACIELKKYGCQEVEFNLGIDNAEAQEFLSHLGFNEDVILLNKVINFTKAL